jgi:hypothetical protein
MDRRRDDRARRQAVLRRCAAARYVPRRHVRQSRWTVGWIIGSIVSTVVGYLINAALVRGALHEVDGQRPSLASFFRFTNVGNVILASILVGVVTAIGLILFVIPGLIVAFLSWWTLQFIIDRHDSAVEGLRSSIRAISSQAGPVFLLALALIGLNILGAIPLGARPTHHHPAQHDRLDLRLPPRERKRRHTLTSAQRGPGLSTSGRRRALTRESDRRRRGCPTALWCRPPRDATPAPSRTGGPGEGARARRDERAAASQNRRGPGPGLSVTGQDRRIRSCFGRSWAVKPHHRATCGLPYRGMWRRSAGPAARVPDLVGLQVRVAQDLALDAGVLAVEHDPRPAPAHSGVVTGQTPDPGRRVRVGSTVWIWIGPDRAKPDDTPGNEGGGGGGRPWLPQGPRPRSPTGHKPTPR